MWLDQLAGKRNFEPSCFTGFINDLLLTERKDWQVLFADLPNGAGFVAKLGDFFARHQGGLRGEDCWYPYFHPLKRNALQQDQLVHLVQQHLRELARIAGLAGSNELCERLSALRVVWSDEEPHRSPMPRDSSDLDIEVYETIGDFLGSGEQAQAPWFHCLKEACYAMAADSDLQRYFMSDYHRVRFNYRAYYELWIGGGWFSFDGDLCLVTAVKRR
jgi:hypothetical protein